MDTVPDLPTWLLEGWQEAYGAEQTAAMENVLRQTPPLDLQFRDANALKDWQAANPGMGHVLTHLPAPGGRRRRDPPAGV